MVISLEWKMLVNVTAIRSILLPYFLAIWCILGSFWYIYHILVCCTIANLATLKYIEAQLAFFTSPKWRPSKQGPRCQLKKLFWAERLKCYPHVSRVTCHVSHMSRVTCHVLFLSPSLSGPAHLLRWVVKTDLAFYFMPGAQQQT
jgi:hypothetical protein